jgi:YYY domain-containing protein
VTDSIRARARRLLPFAPLLLLALALALRLYGYNFDDGQLIQPDELAIDQVVTSLGCCLGDPSHAAVTWPSPISHWFDPKLAPYDPHLFNYGSLPLYLLALITRAAAWIGGAIPALSSWRLADDLVHTNWTGRWLSAIFDVGSLAIAYRIARRAFDPQVALLTLTLGTFCVLEIQLAHFYAVDTVLTFFVLLTLLGAIQVAQGEGMRSYLLMGAAFGAGLATKSSAFPLIIPICAAPILPLLRHLPSSFGRPSAKSLNDGLRRLLIALVAAMVVFAVCEPYGLIDHTQLLSDVQTQNAIIVTHSEPVPYTIQFTGTTPYLFYLKNFILWYAGPALGVMAGIGAIWATWRLLRRRISPAQALLLLWVIPYLLVIGRFWAKFGRYLLPVTPLLYMFGAAFLICVLRKIPRDVRWLGRGAIAAVVLATAGWAFAYMNIYATTNSQIAASRWIYSHLRPGTPFATEGEWDRSLPFCLPQPGQCPTGYNSFQMNLFSADDPSKINRLVYSLTHDDYIVMSTQRFVDSIPKIPSQYPITTRYYRLLFHNRLNFRLVKRFAVHPRLGPWVIDDYPADENFTVFDHADVRIFRRVSRITASRARYLLIRAPTQGVPGSVSVPEADGLPPGRFRDQSSEFRVQGSRFKVQGSKLRIQNSQFRVQSSELGVQGSRFKVQGSRFKVRSLTDQTRLSTFHIRRDERLTAAGGVSPPPIDIGAKHQDTRLMLNHAQWQENQRSPTYDQMFPPHGFGMAHPIVVWLALVELLGLALAPVTFFVFRGLRDRGWVISKTVGLVLVAWLVWALVSLGWLSYDSRAIWAIIAGVVLGGALLWWTQRRTLTAFFRTHGRGVLMVEGVFLAGFAAFVLLRLWYPDLGHQFSPVSPANTGDGRMGEKQLELAFLNAIARSRTFPPLDPFFSGGFINYYYFGYVLVATLCKATTIAPATGFNLAIPTFFGLLVGTAYSIGRTLTRSVRFGLVTAVFVGSIGNLNGLVQLVQDIQTTALVHVSTPIAGGVVEFVSGLFSGRPLPGFDFWASTRLVPPVGIDFAEFPYFTYLFGDLHAHLMAMPMDLAVVALSLSIGLSARRMRRTQLGACVLLGALILGAVEATNPPDFPTYVLVLFAGFAGGLLGARSRFKVQGSKFKVQRSTFSVQRFAAQVLASAGLAGATGVLAVLFFPPLVQGYHPVFNTGLATVVSQAASVRAALASSQPGMTRAALSQAVHDSIVTSLPVYWEIFGLFLFIIVSWLALVLIRSRARRRRDVRNASSIGFAFGAAIVFAGVLALGALDLWLLAFLLGAAAATCGVVLVRWERMSASLLWLCGLLMIAVGLSAFCEIFFVPDYLSGGLAFRMNTVAKAYTDIWVLYAIAAAGALGYMARFVRVRRAVQPRTGGVGTALGGRRLAMPSLAWPVRVWVSVLIIGVLGSLIYTYAGTIARETYRETWLAEGSVPLTLNGMAFMKVAYPGDFAAINWMNAHIRGTPTIIEADQADYNWRSRVAQFTGLPTLFGGIYEPAQRYADEIAPRQAVLEEIYSATPATITPATASQFHISGCPSARGKAAQCLALSLLRAYHVSYVYVGLMERQLWPVGVEKFARMSGLTRVFHQGEVSIYHVDGSET